MKISRSRRVGTIGILFCSLFLMSCSKPSDDVEMVEGIKLNKGAIIENDGEIIQIITIDKGSMRRLMMMK